MLRFLTAFLFAASPLVAGPIESLRDIDYVGQKNPHQTLDLLRPADQSKANRPLVVYVHGGSWESGSKEEGLGMLEALTRTGDYVTATINYRLTGESKWPAQIHDCKAAIRFLRANATKYGIDPDRIGVVGVSAGGQLASMLGTCNESEELEGKLGAFPRISSRVQCVVNFFGPTNFLTLTGNAGALEPVRLQLAKRLFGKESREELEQVAKLASPVHWISRDDAPVFTAHGTADFLVPFSQAKELDGALAKVGVRSYLVPMNGAGHGFENQELNRRIMAFLGTFLRGKVTPIATAPINAR